MDSGASGDQPRPEAMGILHSAMEGLVRNTRSLVEQIAQVGGASAQAVVPATVLSSVGHLLQSMRTAVEEAPRIGDELEVVLGEIRAKRLTVQAVTAELTVLDAQLDVLERALAPLETWNGQWKRMQRTLLEAIEIVDAESE